MTKRPTQKRAGGIPPSSTERDPPPILTVEELDSNVSEVRKTRSGKVLNAPAKGAARISRQKSPRGNLPSPPTSRVRPTKRKNTALSSPSSSSYRTPSESETQTESTVDDPSDSDSEPSERPKSKKKRGGPQKKRGPPQKKRGGPQKTRGGGATKRPRRGQAPDVLQNQPPPSHQTEFTFRCPPFPTGPSANFPWSFSLPAPGQPNADLTSHFSQVSDLQLADVLFRVGCSTVGKSRIEMIQLCIVYAALIKQLSRVPHDPTATSAPPGNTPTPKSHHSQAQPNSDHDITPTNNERRPRPGTSPDTQHISSAQPPLGHPSSPNDLIDLHTPCNNNPTNLPPSPSRAANRSNLNNQNPASVLRADNNETPTAGHSATNREEQLPAFQQTQIIRILAAHSKDLNAVREGLNAVCEDLASILTHQRDLNERFEILSDQLSLGQSAKQGGRPCQKKSDKQSAVPRGGTLKDLIIHHFQALFGICPTGPNKGPPRVPPSPPTAAESRRWLENVNDTQSEPEAAGNESQDTDLASSSSPTEPLDPQYPYCHGPGHPDASQEELKIMHDMMKAKGMQRFRLDFTAPLSSPLNTFCLELAQDIFVALVECKEYQGLQPHECQPDFILKGLRGYAQDRLAQNYRESKWDSEKQTVQAAKQARNARRVHLKNLRVEAALEANLHALIPALHGCCSEDETDDEVTAPVESSTAKNVQKYCKVQRLPWRSKDLTTIFQWLDDQRAKLQHGNPKSRQGNLPRIRRRLISPIDSAIAPPPGLSKVLYDAQWLDSQQRVVIEGLKICTEPSSMMKNVLERITPRPAQ
ncbi:hypothetical protein PtA15_18A329 [Puccinia triticina]|uniref:Uncharacterized protein n=1 Tax=Puccinia triticina TaxID=208348 RepID=A0ABY7D7C1_9BASI|nr:uncharacterized protein PtA15_18A329 [Puccinia triticina]WAQ93271.1 hypothetical protein PtA15_18A329 [Puccinia triticina]